MACWLRIGDTDDSWDAYVNKCLDTNNITKLKIDGYIVKLGDKYAWCGNYPYGYGARVILRKSLLEKMRERAARELSDDQLREFNDQMASYTSSKIDELAATPAIYDITEALPSRRTVKRLYDLLGEPEEGAITDAAFHS